MLPLIHQSRQVIVPEITWENRSQPDLGQTVTSLVNSQVATTSTSRDIPALMQLFSTVTEERSKGWVKPEFDYAYRDLIEWYRDKFNTLQQALQTQAQIYKKGIESGQKFDSDDKTFIKNLVEFKNLISKFFDLLVDKQREIQPEILNQIIDNKKVSFSNLVVGYIHDLSSYENLLEIFNQACDKHSQLVLHTDNIKPLLNTLEACPEQFNKFFDALSDPDNKLKPVVTDIKKYFDKLHSRYTELARTNNISLNFNTPEEFASHTITTDPLLIDQVLNNVVKNAITHLDENKSLARELNIDISFREGPKSETIIQFILFNPTVLDEAKVNELAEFKQGRSTKTNVEGQHKQNGIGLWKSKKTCQLLGGDFNIELDSSLNNKRFVSIVTVQDLAA